MARTEIADGATATATTSQRRVAVAREILDLLRRTLPANTPLELALADDAGAEPPPTPARIVVRGPDALARLLWPPSPDALGEAYLREDIDIEGDIWTALDAGRAFDLRRLGRTLPHLVRLGFKLRRGAAPTPALQRVARLSGRRHSRARDLAAVRFHYDVGNDFYALWLDRRLVYSCAYFETPSSTLDEAQEAKLDLICRKLGLEPGMRLLDIGCGWGSLILFAAERYGVEATGITLSAAQALRGGARLPEAGRAVSQPRHRHHRDWGPRRTAPAPLRRPRLPRPLRLPRRRARQRRGRGRFRPAGGLRVTRRAIPAPPLRTDAEGVGRATRGLGR